MRGPQDGQSEKLGGESMPRRVPQMAAVGTLVAPGKVFWRHTRVCCHGVWLSSRFPLSDRDVQEFLCERGIDVTREAIRQWCLKCGPDSANQLKCRRAQPRDTWHLDEVFVTMNGKLHDLWRAVDQNDNVLDILVQSRRNTQAAKKCFRTLLKGLRYVPRASSPRSSRATVQRSGRAYPGWNIGRVGISTTGVGTRIGRRVNASIGCKDVSQQGMLSGFCRRMAAWPTTSAPDGIGCPHRRTAKRGGSDARVGRRSRGQSGLPQGRVGGQLRPESPCWCLVTT